MHSYTSKTKNRESRLEQTKIKESFEKFFTEIGTPTSCSS